MINEKTIEAVSEAIWTTEFSDGYDRNGSHDAGEYREYKFSLQHSLHESRKHLIEEIAKVAIEAYQANMWQDIKTIPYDEVVYLGSTIKGGTWVGFLYDQTIDEFIEETKATHWCDLSYFQPPEPPKEKKNV